jgi:hypothetical protein
MLANCLGWRPARGRLLAASLSILALAACGGGSDSGSTGPTINPSATYLGFLTADDGSSAGLSLTFAAPVSLHTASASLRAPVSVTGVVSVVGGGTINLTGSVDAGTFAATGGGLTLGGTLEKGVLNGRFTATGGVQGGFAAAASSASSPVSAFCGTYSGTDGNGGSDAGNFHVLVVGKEVVGDVIPAGTTADASLTGFLGTAAPGPNSTTAINVNISAGGETLTATGSINAAGTGLSGTYDRNVPGVPAWTSSGTFSGVKCPGT